MRLYVERFAYIPGYGTFGRMYADEFSCYTCERPWENNRRWVSCIPEGEYPLLMSRYNKGGYDTLEIGGVPDRSRILIHKGNWPRNVQGCIAVGDKLTCMGGELGVSNSTATFLEFWNVVQSNWSDKNTLEVSFINV